MQSVPITTKVTSLNPAHGKVYSIQHYVMQGVSDLQSVVFSGYSGFHPPNKTDCDDITEILLKVVLFTITLTIAMLVIWLCTYILSSKIM